MSCDGSRDLPVGRWAVSGHFRGSMPGGRGPGANRCFIALVRRPAVTPNRACLSPLVFGTTALGRTAYHRTHQRGPVTHDMSARLQVLMAEDELAALRALARQRGMTVSDVVRQALRDVSAAEPDGNRVRKLAAIQAASRHEFPTGDISELLEEIDRGRGSL